MNTHRTSRRRAAVLVPVAALLLTVPAGSALAFDPPADPNDNFTCFDNGTIRTPVLGHPGAAGLSNAMGKAHSMTAWEAWLNSDQIGNSCLS